MKAQELRIGNLVYGISRRSEVHLPNEIPLKIWQIEIFNCEALPHDRNPAQAESYIKISNVDITGIPLTEEWLLKFGFERNESGNYDKRLELFYGGNLYRFRQGWTNVELKYVHQLQNLYFALTGEELTLKTSSPLPLLHT